MTLNGDISHVIQHYSGSNQDSKARKKEGMKTQKEGTKGLLEGI